MNRRGFVSAALGLLGVGGGVAVAAKKKADPMPRPVTYGRRRGHPQGVEVNVSRGWIEALQYPWESFNTVMLHYMWPSVPRRWRNPAGDRCDVSKLLCIKVPFAMWTRLAGDRGRLSGQNFMCVHDTGDVELLWRGVPIISEDVVPRNRYVATFRMCEQWPPPEWERPSISAADFRAWSDEWDRILGRRFKPSI